MKLIIILLWLILSPFALWYTLSHMCEITKWENQHIPPKGWTMKQWQSVIDCTNEPGNGGDLSCDSCYLTKAAIYHIKVDSSLIW
jgi:hypothetical protein